MLAWSIIVRTKLLYNTHVMIVEFEIYNIHTYVFNQVQAMVQVIMVVYSVLL